VRCNWNFAAYGGTGLASVVPAGGVPENYEPPLNVSAGQQYIICFSNWSSVTTVVPLVFGGSAVVSCDPVILPVELTDLHSHVNAWTIDLDWTTATEDNTSHFLVERSTDLWSWDVIGRIGASGTAITQHDYRFTDTSPLEMDTYYRLAIVDLDGTSTTSPIIKTEWEAPTLHCWPSPSTGSFLVALGVHPDEAKLEVLDQHGRQVPFRQRREGDDEIRVDLVDVPGGLYTVRATHGTWIGTGRVVIAHP
jgi:hypothetical protein